MSANRPRLGVNHHTVVPTNFERSDEVDPDADDGFEAETDD